VKRYLTIIACSTVVASVATGLKLEWLLAVILPVTGAAVYLASRQQPDEICRKCHALPAEKDGLCYKCAEN